MPLPNPALLINVAHLVKAPTGASRAYPLAVEALDLGEGVSARGLEGTVTLTRAGAGLLARGAAVASARLTCMRCLDEYVQPVELTLEEEFRPSIDITTGRALAYRGAEVGSDFFLIGEDNVLDLTEALRQAIWLAVPMVPRCREDCPGIAAGDGEVAGADDMEPPVDRRLALLDALLNEGAASAKPAARGGGRRR